MISGRTGISRLCQVHSKGSHHELASSYMTSGSPSRRFLFHTRIVPNSSQDGDTRIFRNSVVPKLMSWCNYRVVQNEARYSARPISSRFGREPESPGICMSLGGGRRFFSSQSDNNKSSSSIFSQETALAGLDSDKIPEWHDPAFLNRATVEEKERWLNHLITSSLGHERDNNQLMTLEAEDGGTFEVKSGNHAVDTHAFNVVIKGWAKESHNPKSSLGARAAFRAEDWLSRLRKEAAKACEGVAGKKNGRDGRSKPNLESYNAVLEAWSNNLEPLAVARAERWFSELFTNSKNNTIASEFNAGQRPILANLESYNHLLAVYAKGHGKNKKRIVEGAIKAEELLNQMLAIFEKSSLGCDPDESQCHFEPVAPNTDSFNYVITAIVKCRNNSGVAARVMEWVRRMENLGNQSVVLESHFPGTIEKHGVEPRPDVSKRGLILNVAPNSKTYSIAISAWALAAQQQATKAARNRRRERTLRYEQVDTTRNMGNLDIGHADEKGKESMPGFHEVRKAEEILKYMHQVHEAGSDDVVPDAMAYNSVIGAWSKISNEDNAKAPFYAEQVLGQMLQFREESSSARSILKGAPRIAPDTFSYTQVIHAWTRTHSLQGMRRAEWWLRKMWSVYHDEALLEEERHSCLPNAFTYNLLIKQFRHMNRATEADELLRELISLSETGEIPIHANSDSFTLVISAWVDYELGRGSVDPGGRGNTGEGCERAFELLVDMAAREEKEEVSISTNKDLFNRVLRGAAESPTESYQLFDIAVKTYRMLHASRHIPDHLSYHYLLQCGLRVLSEPEDKRRREKFIEQVLKAACDNGMLRPETLRIMNNRDLPAAKKAIGTWPPPRSCSRNVKQPKS